MKKNVSNAVIIIYAILVLITLSGIIYTIRIKPSLCYIPLQPNIKKYSSYPKMCINTNKNYTGTISTSLGDINFTLYPKSAPLAVNNFYFLTKSGFYNNTIVDRVVKGFVVQAGSPNGSLTGGPGYKFKDQINPQSLGIPSQLISAYIKEGYNYDYNVKSYPVSQYSIAMANSGPNTNGSQFFIAMAKETQLNGLYTVFGKVTSGYNVLSEIQNTPVDTKNNDKPLQDIKINSITINSD
jgi:cyclophilin family peptidyl-prolyl cis-trans isomerase